jgi:hypothetical protein
MSNGKTLHASVFVTIASLAMSACSTETRSGEGTTYDVYYLGGQSNMEGFGQIEELPDSLKASVSGVWIFHGNQIPDGGEVDGRGIWSELEPGHGVGFSSDGRTNTLSAAFGVELTFARRMLELDPNRRIALIKYSRGGTSIDTAANSYGTWDPDFVSGSGVNQYDHFLATLRNATAHSDIDGDGAPDRLNPAGIVWMQGESDAPTREVAERYGPHLKRLMNLIRAALRVDDLPVVIGRISDSGQDDEDGRVWNYGDLIRSSQAEFVADDPKAALVTSTDEYTYSDKWHYDTAGYIDLGNRFAEAMFSLRRAGP